ncbi:MAG: YdeI/OmpD-associated family protein [Flavipsychrobacter sp.]|nr:YdeI/OmpD-associated family protein [Flavipsychrobacter sp.]
MELLQKLRMDLSSPLWVVDPPANVADVLPGADLSLRKPRTLPARQLVLFARDSGDLLRGIEKLQPCIGPDTIFWIAYPKKSGSIPSDLWHMEPWHVVFDAGFRGQTSVSMNNDWTGMRFTNAPRKKASRSDVPIEQRTTEGVDYVNRTVNPPADVLVAFATCPGTEAAFNKMSFSHKREYMEAIADARKPETRARRIEKMLAALSDRLSQ